jgi:hypothetical protein
LPDQTTFTLAPLGCQAVRHMPDGTWSRRFNYFWEFDATDLRFYWSEPNGGLRVHMAANNVANPALLHRIIDQFLLQDLGEGMRARLDLDAPAYESAAVARYGDVNNATTRLADLYFHRGDIVVASKLNTDPWTFTTVTFNGVEGLQGTFAALGLTVTVDATSLKTRIQETRPGRTTDLIALGTDLFRQTNGSKVNDSQRVALNVNGAGVEVETGSYDLGGFTVRPMIQGQLQEQAVTLVYNLGAGSSNVGVPGKRLNWSTTSVGNFISVDGYQRVMDVNKQYTATGFESTVSVCRVLGGLKTRYVERYLLKGPLQNLLGSGWPTYGFFANGRLVRQVIEPRKLPNSSEMSADGWPCGETGWTNYLTFLNPYYPGVVQFCTDPRIHTGPVASDATRTAANIANGNAAADGGDFDIVAVAGQTFSQIGIQHVRNRSEAVDRGYRLNTVPVTGGMVKVFRNPDWLHKFEATDTWYAANRAALLAGFGKTGFSDTQDCRVILNSELYNLMAQRLNAMQFRHFTFADLRWPNPQSSEYFNLTYDSPGVAVRPRTLYTGWFTASTPHMATFMASVGVPVLTEADLPPSYQEWRDVEDYNNNVVITAGVIGAPFQTPINDQPPQPPPNIRQMFGPDFRWVTLTAMEALATQVGLPLGVAAMFSPMMIAKVSKLPTGNLVMVAGSDMSGVNRTIKERVSIAFTLWLPETPWHVYVENPDLDSYEWILTRGIGDGEISNLRALPEFDSFNFGQDPISIPPLPPSPGWAVRDEASGAHNDPWANEWHGRNSFTNVGDLANMAGCFAPQGLIASGAVIEAACVPDYYFQLQPESFRFRVRVGTSTRRGDSAFSSGGVSNRPLQYASEALIPAALIVTVDGRTAVTTKLIDPRYELTFLWPYAAVIMRTTFPIT